MCLSISRRAFLASSTSGLMAFAASRPAAALPPVSANERIHVAFIGVGGMGRGHLRRLLRNPEAFVVAVSDPDAQRQAEAREMAAEAGIDAAAYGDFREMLAGHPDIDAVFVSTPDHWHALATLHCLRLGKDVYCEKPLALTIAEGRAMVETARRFGRVVQMGTMQRSDQPQFRHVCELVRNGRIGALERVVCFFGENPRQDYVPNEDPPAYLDWDLWLGPAPWRPFNPQIHPYHFRYFRDYSGGMLTDWGVHLFDIAQWGAGKDYTSPRRIETENEMYPENYFEFPMRSRIRYNYDDLVMEWQQNTPEAAEIEPGQTYGTKFYGSEGEIFVNREGYAARSKSGGALDETLGENDERLYVSTHHHTDFFSAMRTRKAPICEVEIGHRATAIAHLGNLATRLGRSLEYDPEGEYFPGDSAANHLLEKPMRSPWHL